MGFHWNDIKIVQDSHLSCDVKRINQVLLERPEKLWKQLQGADQCIKFYVVQIRISQRVDFV